MAAIIVSCQAVGGAVQAVEIGVAHEREGEGDVRVAPPTCVLSLRVCEGERESVCVRERECVLYYVHKLWLPHFRTFCELVEGEENKLTTFSTWTITLGCNESNIIFQQHLCKLGRSNGRNSQVFGQAMKNLWLPHFRTFCELVEGEENKLTTFSTWTIMLGCNFNGRNSQVFGQAMKKRPTGHTRKLWPPHFRTFCELVEGEENKLTTFSTWTIMLG